MNVTCLPWFMVHVTQFVAHIAVAGDVPLCCCLSNCPLQAKLTQLYIHYMWLCWCCSCYVASYFLMGFLLRCVGQCCRSLPWHVHCAWGCAEPLLPGIGLLQYTCVFVLKKVPSLQASFIDVFVFCRQMLFC